VKVAKVTPTGQNNSDLWITLPAFAGSVKIAGKQKWNVVVAIIIRGH